MVAILSFRTAIFGRVPVDRVTSGTGLKTGNHSRRDGPDHLHWRLPFSLLINRLFSLSFYFRLQFSSPFLTIGGFHKPFTTPQAPVASAASNIECGRKKHFEKISLDCSPGDCCLSRAVNPYCGCGLDLICFGRFHGLGVGNHYVYRVSPGWRNDLHHTVDLSRGLRQKTCETVQSRNSHVSIQRYQTSLKGTQDLFQGMRVACDELTSSG